MQVIVIMQQSPDSWNGTSHYRAVAIDEEAAKRWVQDEVDQKHGNGHLYMQGKTADWWINEYPVFKLVPTEVQMGVSGG